MKDTSQRTATTQRYSPNIWHRLGALLALFLTLGMVSCEKLAVEQELKVGRICTWDVPPGQRYAFQDVPPGIDTVDFRARIYQASYDSACKTLDDQLHPLVIVAHGRILQGAPYNYLGMTYLTDHLASWGDIVVSVNLDVVDFLQGEETQWGIPHRGELILHAIEFMIAQSRTPGSPFFQRIDTTKIALVGHSRGGGAVVYAANYNASHRNRPIRAIATLSPANFGTQPLMPPVPHICLYGTWDGDLFDGEGPDIWARGTRAAPRELVEIYGANHYWFTDKANFPPESAEIGRGDHQLLAKGMVNAWLDRYLRGNDRFDWSDYLTGDKRLAPNLEYYVSFQDAHFLPILNRKLGAEMGSSMVGSKLGARLSELVAAGSTCEYCAVDLEKAPDYGVGEAVQATWDARSDQLRYQFPATDASAFTHLSFRASQVHGDAKNAVDQRKDFQVVVADARGRVAKVCAQDYLDGLQYPDLSGSLAPDDPNNRKQIMRGFRIPQADFKGVDFSQVVSVQFVFNRPRSKGFDNLSGVIKVADLEFSD